VGTKLGSKRPSNSKVKKIQKKTIKKNSFSWDTMIGGEGMFGSLKKESTSKTYLFMSSFWICKNNDKKIS
jgi:hypothetical protein